MQNTFLFLLSTLLLVAGCNSNNYPSVVKKSILQLNAEANYASVSRELAGIVWEINSDPELLVAYCSARFTIMPQDATCALDSGSAKEIVYFSDGLWHLWTGRTQEAGAIFERLLNGTETRLWGAIGKLELAQYTERHRNLAELLEAYDNGQFRDNSRFDHLYRRYELAYLESISDWPRLEERLSKYSQNDIYVNPELFSAFARILYVQGKVTELKVLLEAVSRDVKDTAAYQSRRMDYLVMAQGIAAAKKEIGNAAKIHPNNPDIILKNTYSALLSSSPEIAHAAWKKLLETAGSSSNNIRLLLDMATTLASYHKPSESAQVYRLVDSQKLNLDDFIIFHVFSAWVSLYDGDVTQAKKRLQAALTIAPRHISANWLKTLIAKKLDNPKEGAEALEVLVAADPYNRNYYNLVNHFRNKFKSPKFEMLYKEINKIGLVRNSS